MSWDHEEILRFSEHGNFSVAPAEILETNMVLYCQQYLCLFRIVFVYIPGFHDQGMMLALPNQLLCSALSTSD